MAAIRLLQELEFEGLQASPEQQEILSRYVGWGGLADAFDENKPNWSDEFAELYATLSPEEYAARTHLVEGFGKEVVVNGKTELVISPVIYLILSDRKSVV